MTYRLALLIFLLPVFAAAQTGGRAGSLARQRLDDLLENWTLGIDSASETVDIRTYNKFKSLFHLNATINNGFGTMYRYKSERAGEYATDSTPRSFDVYAHDVALQVKGIRTDNVQILDSNTADEANMQFTVAMDVNFQKERRYVLPEMYVQDVIRSRRLLQFEKRSDSLRMAAAFAGQIERAKDSVYRFRAQATLRVTMRFEKDTAWITSIRSTVRNLVCINDSIDHDAVLDGEDSTRTVFGDFTANGKPDYDLDGTADNEDKCRYTFGETNHQGCPASYFITRSKIEFFGGLQMNAQSINLPELDQLGYVDKTGADAMDVLQSKKGALKAPGSITGVYAGGSYTYYFGQRKKGVGLSLGVTYSKFTAPYELTDAAVYTFKANDGTNNYRRQISINRLHEELDYTIFNFPLLFSYRTHIGKGKKSVINLKAGPSVMLFNTTSAYNAVIDFGGLYQIDKDRKDRITYYDYFDPASKFNLYLTSAYLNRLNPSGTAADSIFKLLASKGYDFAHDKNYSGTQTISSMTVTANLIFGFQHKISEGFIINASAHFVYALPRKNEPKYKAIDKTTDEFQSIYNSNAKGAYHAAGLSVGVVYNF